MLARREPAVNVLSAPHPGHGLYRTQVADAAHDARELFPALHVKHHGDHAVMSIMLIHVDPLNVGLCQSDGIGQLGNQAPLAGHFNTQLHRELVRYILGPAQVDQMR